MQSNLAAKKKKNLIVNSQGIIKISIRCVNSHMIILVTVTNTLCTSVAYPCMFAYITPVQIFLVSE